MLFAAMTLTIFDAVATVSNNINSNNNNNNNQVHLHIDRLKSRIFSNFVLPFVLEPQLQAEHQHSCLGQYKRGQPN
jgi:hypothetical protein